MEVQQSNCRDLYAKLLTDGDNESCTNEELGTLVLGIRESLEMNQTSFARVIGMSRQTVVRWEKGTVRIPPAQISQMGRKFPELNSVSAEKNPSSDFEKLVRIARLATRKDMTELIEIINRASSSALAEILEKYSKEVAALLIEE